VRPARVTATRGGRRLHAEWQYQAKDCNSTHWPRLAVQPVARFTNSRRNRCDLRGRADTMSACFATCSAP
jgi:hypothetical protein